MRSRTKSRPDRRWRSRADSSQLLAATLWLVDRLRRPLERMGVEFGPFRELLRVRLVLEMRTLPIGMELAAPGMREMALVLTLMLFWFIGLLSGVASLMESDPLIAVALPQAAFMGLLAFVLLGQYIQALVDPTDLGVFAHQPVSDATLYAVRIAHLFFHAGLAALAFAVGAEMLAPFGAHPLAGLLMTPLLTALATVTTVGSISLFFALVLRVFGPARYQRITLWLQIAIMTLMLGGGQAVAPLMRRAEALEPLLRPELGALFPPIHLMGLYRCALGELTAANLGLAALALGIPLLALWLTLRLASRYFIAGLSGAIELGQPARRTWERGRLARLGARWTRTRHERAGFDFTVALAAREPMFLRLVLPQVIGFQIMGVAFAAAAGDQGQGLLMFAIPMAASMVVVAAPTAYETAQFSKDAGARWLLHMAPVERHDELVRGGVKGLLTAGFGLSALVSVVLLTLVGGWTRLPHIALALELALLATLVFTALWTFAVPFARPAGRGGGQASRNPGLTLALMATVFALVGINVLLGLHWVATATALIAILPAIKWRAAALERIRQGVPLPPA